MIIKFETVAVTSVTTPREIEVNDDVYQLYLDIHRDPAVATRELSLSLGRAENVRELTKGSPKSVHFYDVQGVEIVS